MTYIGEDGDKGKALQDLQPDSDGACFEGGRTSPQTRELVSVEADLHDVVEEGEERGEREGRHEESHKNKLQHYTVENRLR